MIGKEQPGRDRNPRAERDEHAPTRGEASLRYGLQILGLFSSGRPWLEIGEIAEELGLSPLDAHVQVTAMRRLALVQEGPGRRYTLGEGPPDLGMSAIRSAGIARHVRPHLIGLNELTGVPVVLALHDGTELQVNRCAAACARGEDRELEMTIDLNRPQPAHATALGKVLAAYLPEHREHALIETMELRGYTARTIADKRVLLKHLHQIRSQGIAMEDREYMPHRRCVAVPVRGADRRVVAALGLTLDDMDSPMGALSDTHGAPLVDTAMALGATLRHAPIEWPEI